MKASAIIAVMNLIVSLGFTAAFYRAFALRMWRQYYLDKMQALIWALASSAIWPITVPIYLIHRYRIMQRRRRMAEAVADADELHTWRDNA